MGSGEADPFDADVVEVGKDAGDGSRALARRFGLPGAGIEVFEDNLMAGLVDGKGFNKNLGCIVREFVRILGHGEPLQKEYCTGGSNGTSVPSQNSGRYGVAAG